MKVKEYKRLQIIKHALKYYLERPNAIEKDIEQEKRVLGEVKSKVESLKEKYGIK